MTRSSGEGIPDSRKLLEPGRTTFSPGSTADTPTHSSGVLVDLGYDGEFFQEEKSVVALSRLVETADLFLSRSEMSGSNSRVTERAQAVSEYLLAGLSDPGGRSFGMNRRGLTATGDAGMSLVFASSSDSVRAMGSHWGDVGVQVIRTDHSRDFKSKYGRFSKKETALNNRLVFGLFQSTQQLLHGSSLERFAELLQSGEATFPRPELVENPIVPTLPKHRFRDINAPPYDLSMLAGKMAEIGEASNFTHKPFQIDGNIARGELRHQSGVGVDIVFGAYLPGEFLEPTLHQDAEGVFTVLARKHMPVQKRNVPPVTGERISISDAANVGVDILPWVEVQREGMNKGRRASIEDSRIVALDRGRWGAVRELSAAARALQGTLFTDRKTMRR